MRRPTCLSELLGIIVILLVAAAIALMLLAATPAHAADVMPTVCRDFGYKSGIRYQFRNIPQNWIDAGYWYVGSDAFMTQSPYGNVFVADALTSDLTDNSGIKAGEAVFFSSDSTIILRGTAASFPCNLPVPKPPAPTPCAAWQVDSETGELVCLWKETL